MVVYKHGYNGSIPHDRGGGFSFLVQCIGSIDAFKASIASIDGDTVGYPIHRLFFEFINRFGLLAPEALTGSNFDGKMERRYYRAKGPLIECVTEEEVCVSISRRFRKHLQPEHAVQFEALFEERLENAMAGVLDPRADIAHTIGHPQTSGAQTRRTPTGVQPNMSAGNSEPDTGSTPAVAAHATGLSHMSVAGTQPIPSTTTMPLRTAVIGFLAAHCIWNGEVKPERRYYRAKGTLIECVTKEEVYVSISRRFRKHLQPEHAVQFEALFEERLENAMAANKCSLEIEIDHRKLLMADPLLTVWLSEAPQPLLEVMEAVFNEIVFNRYPAYKRICQRLYVRVTNYVATEKIPNLRVSHLEKWNVVRGVVTKVSGVLTWSEQAHTLCRGFAPSGVVKDRAEQYQGKVATYVIIVCIVAAVGGFIFYCDIGISGFLDPRADTAHTIGHPQTSGAQTRRTPTGVQPNMSAGNSEPDTGSTPAVDAHATGLSHTSVAGTQPIPSTTTMPLRTEKMDQSATNTKVSNKLWSFFTAKEWRLNKLIPLCFVRSDPVGVNVNRVVSTRVGTIGSIVDVGYG
ncbi:DNA replication licensing factor MCM2 [Artemisia annua]|uniref:DNA replication licensing factor MCM2 n=1 Tax=Artemisia annua TaxID=35608 RepID=A0A2U1KQB3_ARTAN|nr:DNA replication licensing factor MCM2 [Artemisia annua]